MNLRKLLAIIGFLTWSPPTSLKLALTSKNQKESNIDQKIVVTINNITNYEINVLVNSQVIKLKALVSFHFIKEKLNKEIQKFFYPSYFSLVSINNVNNMMVRDSDLTVIKIISAKIIYNYGKIYNQIVNLTINVVDSFLN